MEYFWSTDTAILKALPRCSTQILIVAAALLCHHKSCSEGVRQQPIHERRHCTTGLLQALGVKNNVLKRFNF